MKQFQTITRLSAVFAVVLFVAGSSALGRSEVADVGPVSKEAVLRQAVANVIRAGYEDLALKCGELKRQSEELSGTRDLAKLKKAQETWVAAMLAARRIQAYKAGPVVERECTPLFYYWQVLPVRLEAVLASVRPLDRSHLDELGATTKGLFAME